MDAAGIGGAGQGNAPGQVTAMSLDAMRYGA